MDKYIYDDKNGLWYELQGDYYIPCRDRQTGKGYVPSVDKTDVGASGRKSVITI